LIIAEATLIQDGKAYTYSMPYVGCSMSNEDDLYLVESMWTDGNYSCDCNRAAFIAQLRGEDDPDAPCGNTIMLLSLVATDEEHTRRVLLYHKPLDVQDERDWTLTDLIIVPAHEMPRWEV